MFYLIQSMVQQGMSFSRMLAFGVGYLFAIVLAFGLHEYAHALTAYKLGDPTPKALGRLTVNPLKHIDPYGLIGFLVVGFGWAKPVEVNPLHFKKYRRDMFFVSVAGVLTNLLLAFILSGIFYFFFVNVAQFDISGNFTYSNDLLYLIHYFLEYSIVLNIALFVFNLIPIYPLDGFNAVKSIFRLNNKFLNFMYRWGNLILIVVICLPFFDAFYNIVTGFITETFFSFWGLFV
ncbi:MAG: site-2 protease family protein [Clostridiales bacterium]|nr:site-2 protease family protein [Clostridiales bacterium]